MACSDSAAMLMIVVMLADVCSGKTARLTGKKPPHIVFIVADDLGWNDVGWHNTDMITPNLNWLASRGVILDSTYAQPSCTPSRNSFMTGFFPYHTELQDVIEPSVPLYLPLKHVLLPQRLKQQGYATHIVGKWHLGFCNKKYTPTERGFDSFFGFYTGSVDHYWHEKTAEIQTQMSAQLSLDSLGSTLINSLLRVRTSGQATGRDFRFNDTVWTEAEGIYSTTLTAVINCHQKLKKKKNAFCRQSQGDHQKKKQPEKPLFLYLPKKTKKNSPLSVPAKYQRLYRHIKSKERRIYSGMVTALDEAVGNITSALFQSQLIDNLLLVFTSDNGGHPYMGGSNSPLRGGKNTIWEGGTRVPTFVYSSTLLRRRGYANNRLFHAVDWYPTILELAGAKPEKGIDGRSQWKMLSKAGESSRKEFVYNIGPNGDGAIRAGDYKLITGHPGFHNDWYPTPGAAKIARRRFKGGRFDQVKLTKSPYLLFNIEEDPEEKMDLSMEKPDILREMLKLYEIYNSTKIPPHTATYDAAADPAHFNGFWSPGWC
ncbi:unnamed protein product [Candidula unifasciata]|uniref:Sulfatase N-terminal domain-containing protein n=1 Tax=Candidula unifasciata TaxID=100452 RepID=A0A8S3YS43_9EUPU|nr:unnamed protein product [Candidula unifasciata]